MGVLGDGVYESDNALDFVGPLLAMLSLRIVFHLADESFSGWPSQGYEAAVAAAEILALCCERAETVIEASPTVVRRWREICLQRFEADPAWDNRQTPDGLDARAERRKVIETTFDRLEAVALDMD